MTSTLIQFEQISNFRDLSFETAEYSNGITKGKLFRCANPANASESDRKAFQKLNIDIIFDLRDEVEIAKDLNDSSLGIERVHLSLLEPEAANPNAMHETMKAIAAGHCTTQELLAPVYDLIDQRKINAWKTIFNSLNQGKNIVFHCTAGRDRTGITAALIQLALGMDRQSVINDHMLSNNYLQTLFEKMEADLGTIEVDGVRTTIAEILLIKSWMMETFLNRISAEYGTIDNFLKILGADIGNIQKHYLNR